MYLSEITDILSKDHLIDHYGFADFVSFGGILSFGARSAQHWALFGQCGFSLFGGGNAARRAISAPSVLPSLPRNRSASCCDTP